VPIADIFEAIRKQNGESAETLPFTISPQDREEWRSYQYNLKNTRTGWASEFLKTLGSMHKTVNGPEPITKPNSYVGYEESRCNTYHGFANINVSKTQSVSARVMLNTRLPRNWKDWLPVYEFLNNVKNQTSSRLDAAWYAMGNFLFDEQPKLMEKEYVKFPYIHVSSKGPPIHWTFDESAEAFSCKVQAVAGDLTFDRQSLLFVGKMVPTTLAGLYSPLDIAFGIVLQTAMERPGTDAENPDKYINVFEMVLAPTGIAAVTVDWGMPSRRALGARYYNLLEMDNEQTKLKVTNFVKFPPNIDLKQRFNDAKIKVNELVDKDPPLREFHTVSDENVTANMLETASKVVCKFTYEALQLHYETHALKYLTHCMLMKAADATITDVEQFVEKYLEQNSYMQYQENEINLHGKAGERMHAMKCISAFLHLQLGMFPFSHGFAKCLNVTQERRCLKDLKALFIALDGLLNTNSMKETDYKEVFTSISRAVKEGIEFPPALHAALKHRIETMKFFRKEQQLDIEDVALLEYAGPCAVSRVRVNINAEPMNIVVNLGFLKESANHVFNIMRDFMPYSEEYYDGATVPVNELNAQAIYLKYKRRSTLPERNDLLNATSEITDDSLFIRLDEELNGRKVQITSAMQSRKAPNVTRTPLMHETTLRFVNPTERGIGPRAVENLREGTAEYEQSAVDRQKFGEFKDLTIVYPRPQDAPGQRGPGPKSRSASRQPPSSIDPMWVPGSGNYARQAQADPLAKYFRDGWPDISLNVTNPPTFDQIVQRHGVIDNAYVGGILQNGFNQDMAKLLIFKLSQDKDYQNAYTARFASDSEDPKLTIIKQSVLSMYIMFYDSENIRLGDNYKVFRLLTRFKRDFFKMEKWVEGLKLESDDNDIIKFGLLKIGSSYSYIGSWQKTEWQLKSTGKLTTMTIGNNRVGPNHPRLPKVFAELFMRNFEEQEDGKKQLAYIRLKQSISMYNRLKFLNEAKAYLPTFVDYAKSKLGEYRDALTKFQETYGGYMDKSIAYMENEISEYCSAYAKESYRPACVLNSDAFPILPYINQIRNWKSNQRESHYELVMYLLTQCKLTATNYEVLTCFLGNVISTQRYLGLLFKKHTHEAITEIGSMYRSVFIKLQYYLVVMFEQGKLEKTKAVEISMELNNVRNTLKPFYIAMHTEIQWGNWVYPNDDSAQFLDTSPATTFYTVVPNSSTQPQTATDILTAFSQGQRMNDTPENINTYILKIARRHASYDQTHVQFSQDTQVIFQHYDQLTNNNAVLIQSANHSRSLMANSLRIMKLSLATSDPLLKQQLETAIDSLLTNAWPMPSL